MQLQGSRYVLPRSSFSSISQSLGSARIGFSPFNDTCRENCSIPYLKRRRFHVTHLRFVFGKFHDDPHVDDVASRVTAWKAYNEEHGGPGGRTQLRFEGPRIPAHPWLELALQLTTNHSFFSTPTAPSSPGIDRWAEEGSRLPGWAGRQRTRLWRPRGEPGRRAGRRAGRRCGPRFRRRIPS